VVVKGERFMRKTGEKFFRHRMQYASGSFTVEASLLMVILIPILAAILYLGIYLHGMSVMKNGAYELAVLESMGEENGPSFVERRKKELQDFGFYGIRQVHVNIERSSQQVTVKINGTCVVPGLVMRYFNGNRLSLSGEAQVSILQPGKKLIRIQKWKKLTGGS
jgi:hypothetical protein